jgi:glutathione S-transferase
MKLYFSPLACSLATRICLYEAAANVDICEVDAKTKKTAAGDDYLAVYPLGLVPALRLDDGSLLTENAAILMYVATRFPAARLAPTDDLGRARLHQWLCFIGTELHKALYVPLLDKKAPEDAKRYALSKADARLAWVAKALEGHDYLLGEFSAADAYLFTILNWSQVIPVDLAKHPPLTAFMDRMHARPQVARAFDEEKTLYLAELARHAAA